MYNGREVPMRKGSQFVSTSAIYPQRPKPNSNQKKSIFSQPYDEFPVSHRRNREVKIGDSLNEVLDLDNVEKQSNQQEAQRDDDASMKYSKTLVVKNGKLGGHFAKLKKKEHYKKFIESQAKSQEMHLDVEKLQSKIEQLTKIIEMKGKGAKQVEPKVAEVSKPTKIDKKEIVQAFGSLCMVLVLIFLVVFMFEGKKIFSILSASPIGIPMMITKKKSNSFWDWFKKPWNEVRSCFGSLNKQSVLTSIAH